MASISAVSICNVALIQLGASPIHSLAQADAQAAACASFYERARPSILAKHPWNFAIRRVELPPDADAPAYQFKYQFTLPADCLRVLTVDGDPFYKAEGRKVLTNRSTCHVKYIADVTDTSEWSQGYIDVLIARLRFDLAFSITGNEAQVSMAKQLFELAFQHAKGVDASEDFADDFGQFDNTLITARY